MARRRRGRGTPEPDVVDARPPRWFIGVTLGLTAVLVWPPVAAVVTGAAAPASLLLALWPLALFVVIVRSRLVADRDGVVFRFIGTRNIAWSSIEALVVSSASSLRGPYLQVRDARAVPLNGLWRFDGKTLPEALTPWARHKRVRIVDAGDAAPSKAKRGATLFVLIGLGTLTGILLANLLS